MVSFKFVYNIDLFAFLLLLGILCISLFKIILVCISIAESFGLYCFCN